MKTFLTTYRMPLLLGLLCVVFYYTFAYHLERSDFIRLLTLYGGLFYLTYQLIKIYGTSFWLLALLGIVARVIFFPALPNLSQDFYRFIWDGRLVWEGVSPYLFSVDTIMELDVTTVSQAAELRQGMGDLNASHFSNYPPVNQLFFTLAAALSGKSMLGAAMVMRGCIIAADVGILYFGRKLLTQLHLPQKTIFWYFLNPFIIIELTGNLHFEGVMLFFVVVGLYCLFHKRWVLAALCWGLSISTKLLPLLLLPLFFQYFLKPQKALGFWKLIGFYAICLGTVLLTFLPFLNQTFIENFAATIGLWFQKFEFNASIYYIIRWIGYQVVGWNIIQSVGKILPLVVIALLLVLTFFRRNTTIPQLLTAMTIGLFCYFLLSTTVHPWYVATPLLLCLFTRYRFPVLWSGTVMLSYAAYGEAGFDENLWLVALEYLIVIGFFLYEVFSSEKNTSSRNPLGRS
ncbi:mannosyltransferase [Altibacter sp. HG106]|uniref:mannosyltransferase n=1 Tax=Altibacter sp. HG106 TaxID=3023937 RepID=UPI0023500494|nr:mannosyltransferase [Altibacter sp. HG106]MDC7994222.1 mannosyltransferase [Altibacter sp. HG106]